MTAPDPLAALAAAAALLRGGDAAGALTALAAVVNGGGLTLTAIGVADNLVKSIAKSAAADVPRLRVAVLCGALSPAMLMRTIRVALAGQGVLAELHEGTFNGLTLDTLNPASEYYRFRPELTVVAVGWRDALPPGSSPRDAAGIAQRIAAEVKSWSGIWAGIARHTGAPVIQHLYDKPDQFLTGTAERRIAHAPQRYLDQLNAALLEAAPASVSFLDLDALACHAGLAQWAAGRDYFLAKLPFASRQLPHYATAFAATWRDMAARGKKVLVLDLDNTMWGGVIGDDGIDGVQFGQGGAKGEAYLAFAWYVKALKDRGVTLAVLSKNDPELPEKMFAGHRGMPLRMADFAAFTCNWRDKPGNLRAMARELNLGLNAFVFMDDNPAECELMRQSLPEVTVIQAPADPSDSIPVLDGARLFDIQRLTATDALRAESYQALKAAGELKASASSLEEFLAGLEMKAEYRAATPADLDRLAQMEARTNQFNFTTRRYTADDIAAFMRRKDAAVLTLSLGDRLAQHGMVASAIAVEADGALRIESWLMSCRVFSRSVEQYMMQRFVEEARARGLAAVTGQYLKTPRNDVVADLYLRLGFAALDADGTVFRLEVAKAEPERLQHYITAADGA